MHLKIKREGKKMKKKKKKKKTIETEKHFSVFTSSPHHSSPRLWNRPSGGQPPLHISDRWGILLTFPAI